jgi:hypothetical protein
MKVSKKPENRGAHLREKVSAGNAPKPWLMNVEWAKRIQSLEKELAKLLEVRNIRGFVLPWCRVGCIPLGNSNKALYVQLVMHHLNKVVDLEFTDKVGQLGGNNLVGMSKDFLGIEKIRILDQKTFNADGTYIHSSSWARVKLSKGQFKAVSKLWTGVGLAVSMDGNTYTFDAKLSTTSKKRAAEDDTEKRRKKQTAVIPDPIPMAVSTSVIPHLVMPRQIPMAVMPPRPIPTLPVFHAVIPQFMMPRPVPTAVPTAMHSAPTLLRVLELSDRRSKVAALRAQASNMLATANRLRVDAAGLNTDVMTMHAHSGRLEQLAATTLAEAARLELMLTSHPAPCVTTALLRLLELSNQCSKVAAHRTQAAEVAASAKLLRANAVELNARVMAMHADSGRLDQLAATTFADAAKLEMMM